MDRILKTFCILTVVFFVAITFGSGSDRGAYAGGGINYKVTVRNDTEHYCQVYLHYGAAVGTQGTSTEFKALPKNSSVTFETGSLCPCGLTGTINVTRFDGWEPRYKLEPTNMLGAATVFSPICKSATFRICRKRGTETFTQDNDFGFCKE